MNKIKNKKILKLIMFFSLFVIFSAYFIEHILGHKPCSLCFFERIPYFLSIALIIITMFINKLEKIILMLLSLLFIFGLIISFYHFGIEQGFFEESTVCAAENLNQILSKEDLLKQLEQKTISCKDVTFRFLGLSLASINTIFSLILSYIFFKMFKNYENNK